MVMGLFVESFADHGGLLSTTLYHQISAKKVLAAILFKIIIEMLSETAQWPTLNKSILLSIHHQFKVPYR